MNECNHHTLPPLKQRRERPANLELTRDSNPDLFNAGAMLSGQLGEDHYVVDFTPVDVEIDIDNTGIFHAMIKFNHSDPHFK